MTARDFTIFETRDALVAAAAGRIAAILATVGPRGAVCLTGGSTIGPVHRALAAPPLRDKIPVDRLDWFFGDERFVPAGHELSNAAQARATLLEPLGVPAERIHAVPTAAATPQAAADAYARTLAAWYGAGRLDPSRPLFDLVLLGMGADGHVASLFPGQPGVEETERWVVGVDEAGHPPHVARVSLTLQALASSRALLFIVAGSDKRPALSRVLSGDDLPAARVRSMGPVVWLVDRAAAPERPSKDRS
ncbi:6-phosphogluconolactonase [Rhodoplanes sp. TEM]|uniref:6-phosphogluconolactonase n=1 Tax=Rhodoplanes tepidamans TaxID=200616 RepID=A0ABT5JBM7_RHOTP|nr:MULTISPECIES: 6-phosphogluconolactonase [Rhodoplanes]MDC7786953.1 6-phosphogluconolactonase [Rhodoplanes tepidamans]MDC7985056.1 6-phosphogluconolactonase [Rhodoplanes sp. TEM]MDQ0355350.1 6-phosphogluconolactonase [Rhodoplanes tepidamans]